MTFVVTLGGAVGVPGAGSSSFGGVIPNDPSLRGVTFYAQGLIFDSAAPSNAALTAGLETHIE